MPDSIATTAVTIPAAASPRQADAPVAAAAAEAPDSVLRMPRHAVARPFDADLDHALYATVQTGLDMSLFDAIVAEAAAPPAWTTGHQPHARLINPAGHSMVLGLLAILFVACILAYSFFGSTLGNFIQNLWSVRRRQNAFDEGSPGRRRIQLLLALQLAAYGGVLLYAYFSPGPVVDASLALTHTLRLMGLAAAYYIFQLCAYSTVAYAFAPDPSRGSQWLEGFNASQGLAGLCLALPTLGMVFYPGASGVMLAAAAAIYIAARLVFIAKGFKIFYTGFTSLIYFILYLCTLEIVPVFCVGAIAADIVARQ